MTRPTRFFTPDLALQTTLTDILDTTWEAFPQLAQHQIAITWICYEPPYRINTGGGLSAKEFWQYRPKGASYRGVELLDPAQLVSLFYLVAMQVWLEQGMAQPNDEIERAMADMMATAGYDATSYLVDVLTGTTSGPSLQPGPLATWQSQRNLINRYFQTLNWPELRAINLNQKIWGDGPYGRERDFLGQAFENRNQLSTEAIARLLHSIIGGVSVSAARSRAMMSLLAQPATPSGAHHTSTNLLPTAPQLTASIREGLSPTVTPKIWSKSGHTATLRHEAAYIEVEGVHPYLLVICTAGESNSSGHHDGLIPFVSKQIFAAVQQVTHPAATPDSKPNPLTQDQGL